MKRFPIELACDFEYCGVDPEEKWRLALYCVSVGSTAVNDLVRHHRVHGFTVNWLRMQKRWKANCDGERDYPKHGQGKSPRAMNWHIHRSREFPDVLLLKNRKCP